MDNPFLELNEDEQEAFIERYFDLFCGREETYAIRAEFGDKIAYMPSTYDGPSDSARRFVDKVVRRLGTSDFTGDIVRAHLTGKEIIGAYPLRADSMVTWFALDFDKKKPDDPDPWEAAVEQALILKKEAGLTGYIERSQGGKGFHLWYFLDGPVDAGRLRHAISPYLPSVESFDRMFPCQNGVTETRPLGNLIVLPLNGSRVEDGNTCFVRRGDLDEPVVHDDQIEFIYSIQRNSVERIDELFEEAGQYVPEREKTKYEGQAEGFIDGYKVIHPVIGCEFVHWCWDHPEQVDEPLWYALACNFAQLRDGRQFFHEWSARDTLRYNRRQTDLKYNQAVAANKPHSCEVIRGLGGNCECDRRFPGKVYHPFDLAELPLALLLDEVPLQEDGTRGVADGLYELFDWLEQVARDPTLGRGEPTGIPTVDESFGYRDGEITILAARNSVGKTARALAEANYLARERRVRVAFHSLEMSKRQILMRLAANGTGVNLTRMQHGLLAKSDWDKLRAYQEEMREYVLEVDDYTASLDGILESAARFVYSGEGRAIIYVDYIQIIQRLPNENEQDAISRCMAAFKRFAKVMPMCHIVILCQLNRGADDATIDSKAYDSWLRGSGTIEQVADNIRILLGEKAPEISLRTERIHKQRNGPAGIVVAVEFNQVEMRWGPAGTWGVTARKEEGEEDRPKRRPRVKEEDLDEFGDFAENLGAPADHPGLKTLLEDLGV